MDEGLAAVVREVCRLFRDATRAWETTLRLCVLIATAGAAVALVLRT